MKSIYIRKLFVAFMLVMIHPTLVGATVINTGRDFDTNTYGEEMITNILATPRSMIRFEIGGAKFTTATGITVSASVDAITPAVISGTVTDQAFVDDAVGAAFYGHYISTGVISTGQTLTNMTVKIQKGAGETSGRTYYLLGNGVITPTQQSDLTIAPAAATVIATTTKNAIHCGPNYNANGLTDAATDCAAGTTVANMDVTQFTKILWSDPPSVAIVSQLSFSAVVQ